MSKETSTRRISTPNTRSISASLRQQTNTSLYWSLLSQKRPPQEVYLRLCVSRQTQDRYLRQTHVVCLRHTHVEHLRHTHDVSLCISASHICVCASADLRLVSASYLCRYTQRYVVKTYRIPQVADHFPQKSH